MDNLVRTHPRANRAGAASLSLVTTDEVSLSLGMQIKAQRLHIKLFQFRAKYQMVT